MISTPSYRCLRSSPTRARNLSALGLLLSKRPMRLWRRLRYFLGASLVRLDTRGAVGLIMFISSLSMFVSSKNAEFSPNRLFLLPEDHCVVRILNPRQPSRGELRRTL